MTTWEPARPADIELLRVLIRKVRRSGQTPPLPEDQLNDLTKKQAGVLTTQLREMLNDPS